MVTDDKPPVLWFNGAIVPWHEARVHVWSELAIRGASVFEGIRAYWDGERRAHYVLALDTHLRRLRESSQLLRFPDGDALLPAMRAGALDLVRALGQAEDLYVRPTIYIDEGRYGWRADSVRLGSYVVAFPVPRVPSPRPGVRCCVSTWRRADDLVMSPRVKAGAAYLAMRLPHIEADQRGLDDAILLNSRDKVSETTGAALFLVRRGAAVTPPLTAGILESITRDLVIGLLRGEGVRVDEREVDRTELYVADEVFMCGTLCEVQEIVEIDGMPIAPGGVRHVTPLAQRLYERLYDPRQEASAGLLTEVPQEGTPRTR
jgi:branched-chain amino acid aminotransferase